MSRSGQISGGVHWDGPRVGAWFFYGSDAKTGGLRDRSRKIWVFEGGESTAGGMTWLPFVTGEFPAGIEVMFSGMGFSWMGGIQLASWSRSANDPRKSARHIGQIPCEYGISLGLRRSGDHASAALINPHPTHCSGLAARLVSFGFSLMVTRTPWHDEIQP